MPEDRTPLDRLVVVGDRVLIAPDEGDDRTDVGLYLPRWAVEPRRDGVWVTGARVRPAEDRERSRQPGDQENCGENGDPEELNGEVDQEHDDEAVDPRKHSSELASFQGPLDLALRPALAQ